jgi:2-oxoglutarate ferredoxin oxidoreductase subunit beta
MTTSSDQALTKKDFVPEQDVRWCPGCGDYAILNAIQKVFPTLGIPREKFVVISGIGCSSRFPYYMNTYGFHSIHGRAPTLATGVKLANPDLSVWVITGDGDGLSIGGNHLLHILRRNLDVNILLFNNQVYGLTKGQYSPTSKPGMRTKTSPEGSIDQPINPLCFAIASQATFVARTVDKNPKHMSEVFTAAANHKGTSFVEIMQNCVIFNDKIWDGVADREVRDDRLLMMNHGEKLTFGKEKTKGIRLKSLQPQVVTVGEEGVTEDDLHTHDASDPSPAYAYLLTQMQYPEYPTPMGVFRDVTLPTYDDMFEDQIKSAYSSKGPGSLQHLLRGTEYWEVEGDKDHLEAVPHVRPDRERTEEMDVMVEQLTDESSLSSDPLTSAIRRPVKLALEQFGSTDVISIGSRDSISDAIALFKEHEIAALPVIDKEKLVGIITERDILMKVVGQPIDRDSTPVKSIMTRKPETLYAGSTIGEALNTLSSGHFRHLPIRFKDGSVGLISVKGLLSYLGEATRTES